MFTIIIQILKLRSRIDTFIMLISLMHRIIATFSVGKYYIKHEQMSLAMRVFSPDKAVLLMPL